MSPNYKLMRLPTLTQASFPAIRLHTIGLAAVALLLASELLMAEPPAEAVSASRPDPSVLLQQVRMNAGSREVHLQGQLREKNTTLPFELQAKNGLIRYIFKSVPLEIALKLGQDSAELLDGPPGGPLVPADPGEPLPKINLRRGELALDFLYWPDAKVERDETINSRACWLLRLNAPSPASRYSVVFVWIDKRSGALLRMNGHDWKGRLAKRFEVRSVRKTSIGWVLKQMRIQQFDETGAISSRIYLEISGEPE